MDQRWKAIRKKRRDAAIELYDQKNDPSERQNIAADQLALVERARTLFQTERTDTPDWPIQEAAES